MKLIPIQHEQQYSLRMYAVIGFDGETLANVPVVNSWIQLSLEFQRLPDNSEKQHFMNMLQKMVCSKMVETQIDAWFFLHKPPGIILRFHFSDENLYPDKLVSHIIDSLSKWELDWLQSCYFDSYFEHRELFSGVDQRYVNSLLTLSCKNYLDVCLEDGFSSWGIEYETKGSIDLWVSFLCEFLNYYIRDSWLTWEAVKRFSRMRKQIIARPSSDEQKNILYNPSLFLSQISSLKYSALPGFDVSTSILQCVNYIFNQWAIDLSTQEQIISKALEVVRPEILPDE